MKKFLFAFAVICILSTAAYADEKFGIMDTDNNDSVSWEEFSKTYPSMKELAFQTIDKDSSGGISHDEWHGFMSGHNKGGQKGGGMMGGMMGGKKMGGSMGGKPELIAPPAK